MANLMMPVKFEEHGKEILAFFKPYFQEIEEKAWMYDELSK